MTIRVLLADDTEPNLRSRARAAVIARDAGLVG